MKHIATLFLLLVLNFPLAQAPAPTADDYGAVITFLADVPFTFDVGSTKLINNNLGVLVGFTVYPLPLLLEGELNIDIAADVTYRRGGEPFYLVFGGGPRYHIVASDWLDGNGRVGGYAGVGGVAGLEFDLNVWNISVLDAVAELSADYTVGTTDGATPALLTVRLGVGVSLPLARASVSF